MSKPLLYLVIHCTATAEGRAVSKADIRSWHLSPPPRGRGWKQVGYSDMIHLDGVKENLVPYDEDPYVEGWEMTNGVAGMNSVCRHVVYVGGTDRQGNPKDTRTDKQKGALARYVREFLKNHPTARVAGHNQFSSKACPSFNTVTWLREIGIPEANIYKP